MNCLLVLAAVGLKQKYNFRILEREKIHYRKNVTTVKKIVSCENSNLTKFKENVCELFRKKLVPRIYEKGHFFPTSIPIPFFLCTTKFMTLIYIIFPAVGQL